MSSAAPLQVSDLATLRQLLTEQLVNDMVLATQQFESKQTSELTVVQTMLEALYLEGVVFTLNALHYQKKLPK